MLNRCLFLLFFSLSLLTKGQYYSLGQNPSSTKWRQINTENFQLIFPVDFEDKAQELANILKYANEHARLTLKTKHKKISIILQNNTTVDNGFVTLAPKRSEFYGTPSQENEGVDWLKKLAVHEYRHVIQFEKYNQGVGKLLHFLLGEQGMGALLLATTPLWFMEGDAVDLETKFTERGRGDYAKFTREFKAQIMELDSVSYEKASFGSYKDFIADHYKLGYYLRIAVGDSIWDELLKRVVRNPFPPYPFSYHLKRLTGKSTSRLYGEVYSNLKKQINQMSEFELITPKEYLSPVPKEYISYSNPIVVDDSTIITVKKSFDQPLRIVSITNGKERFIHIPSRFDENSLNYQNGKLIWAEKRSHPRWDYLDYSEVIVYDLNQRNKRRIKRKTRWFAPDLNSKADQIAVLEVSKDNQYSLLLVDLKGEELKRIYLGNEMYYHPNWFNNDKIVLSCLNNGESYLVEVDLNSGEVMKGESYSIPFSYPKPYKEGYLAQTIYNEKDIIVYIKNDELFEVVNPQFGLDFFSLKSKNEIVYADYHNNGSKVAVSEIEIGDRLPWRGFVKNPNLSVSQDTFLVKKYLPLLHLFNFHSWAPVSLNPNEETANLGASLFSQNLLSSSILSLNYDYFYYTQAQKISANYDFEHYYLKLFSGAYQEIEPNTKVQGVNVFQKTTSYQAGSSLGLYFDGSRFRKSFYLQGAYVNTLADFNFAEGYIDQQIKQENTQWFAVFSVSHKTAVRDLYSPWSFSATSAFYSNLKETQHAQLLNLTSTIPGVFKNDGFKFTAGRQWGTDLFVPNYLSEPRGVLNQTFKRGEKISVEYGAPIVYPDLKISRLCYIQRIRMNLFYDFMQINDDLKTNLLSSQGGTIYFDFNPLRYSYLTSFGIQLGTTREGEFFAGPSLSINY